MSLMQRRWWGDGMTIKWTNKNSLQFNGLVGLRDIIFFATPKSPYSSDDL
jgi:hypothetical protein